jgi:hypothetical protein
MGLRAGSKLGIRGRDVKPTQSPAQASLNGAPRSEVDAMRLGRPLKARLRKERDRLAIRQQSGKVLQRPTRETATGGASRFVSGTLIQSRDNLTMGNPHRSGGDIQ